MGVIATISEWTLAFSLVEMLTWNLSESVFVLLHQIILVWPTVYHVVAGNYHVRSLTTNWTGTEVLFSCSFVVGSTPTPDAFETKSVVTRVKDAKLLSLGKNRFQANLALFIVLLYVGLFFGRAGEITRIASFWM
jgi:hypothetical protein